MAHSTEPYENLHIYFREIKPDERSSLSVLVDIVSANSRVLDLGTGSGALGHYLRLHKTCIVDGVTYNAAEAAHASPHYRRIEVADLDSVTLTDLFPTERYDFIICADVLEHLKQPEHVLAECQKLLQPNGQLLISIPNAGYAGLIAELLEGEFKYRDEGLLDRTHLRFFTRRSLQRFLDQHGWHINAIETIDRSLPTSEFTTAFDSLPPAVARHLLAIPDALSYQFITRAQPKARHEFDAANHPDNIPQNTAARVASTTKNHALFSTQLFWGTDHHYNEAHKLTTTGVIGQMRQTLRFALSDCTSAYNSLRLDLADRPGFLHLYQIRLLDAQDQTVWQWSSATDTLEALVSAGQRDLVLHQAWPGAATMVLLTGDDPWVNLPIPTSIFSTLGATELANYQVEVSLSWPMSADYLALSNAIKPLSTRIEELENCVVLARDKQHQIGLNAQQQHTELQAHIVAKQQENADLYQQYADANQQYAELSQRSLGITKQNQSLIAAKNHLVSEQHALQRYTQQLEQERAALQHQINAIHNSTVIRVTRPLVRLKMRLDTMRASLHQPTAAAPIPITPPTAPNYPVDIIVPVYRGLADTRLCVESVLASQCKTPFRLIVINDASPDPEVTTWLRQMEGKDPRFMLLENPENLGFVGTVNRGMALSDQHDVLLLNSDTEVANDWLDRLHNAAWSDQKVASVTPFSTNATICSYPHFCQDNPLPAGYTTAQIDRLFAQTHLGKTLDIPTAIGFCMYIRRDCLTNIGLFDVANFGKGYGEENDFCRRAANAGWRNLHALDTFVLHTGGVSFGATKSAREIAAMETLRRLHPDYENVVHQFVQADPARSFRYAIDIARLQADPRPAVLAIVHNLGGGTQRQVEELAQHLAQQAQFFTLTSINPTTVKLQWLAQEEGFTLFFTLPEQFDALLTTLRAIGISQLHFHHLLGHHAIVQQLPMQLNVPYDFTAHDFYTLCPQISLTDAQHQYCGEQGADQCRQCLQRRPTPNAESIEDWRLKTAQLLSHARHVLCPSLDTARRMVRLAPQADIRLAPHTDIAQPCALTAPQPKPISNDAPLRIVVIGALGPIKGADTLEAVALEAARQNSPVEFHLIGYAYRHLRTQPHAKLTVHGKYAESDLPELLAWLKPDLAWFPAQWPETYCYTLSACLEANLPIVAPGLGAFPERLQQRPWSWLMPWTSSPTEWLTFFSTIRSQHFLTGQAPNLIPIQPNCEADAQITAWNYADDYLVNPATANSTANSSTLNALRLDFLQAHARIHEVGLRAMQTQTKRGALSALRRIRALRGMHQLEKLVPTRWKMGIKRWLE